VCKERSEAFRDCRVRIMGYLGLDKASLDHHKFRATGLDSSDNQVLVVLNFHNPHLSDWSGLMGSIQGGANENPLVHNGGTTTPENIPTRLMTTCTRVSIERASDISAFQLFWLPMLTSGSPRR
jgi:hypothetical protein